MVERSAWKRLVRLFMVYLLVAGALRKWVFPSFEMELFLLGDAILLAAYLSYLLRGRRVPHLAEGRVLYRWLVLFAACAAGSLLVHFTDPVTGLVGLRYYCIYLPLVYLVPEMYGRLEELYRDLYIYTLTLIPLGLLAAYQFRQAPTSVWNRYVNPAMDIAMVGEHTRVTSTFSYITGFTDYLTVVGLVLVALYFWTRKKRKKTLFLVMIVLAVECMFMTGSRAPVLAVALSLPVVSLLFLSNARMAVRNILFLILLAVLVVVGTQKFGRSALDAFTERAEVSQSDMPTRLWYYVWSPVATLEEVGPLGIGAGMSFQQAALVPEMASRGVSDVVNDRVVMDLGVVGLALEIALSAVILWGFFKVAMTARDLPARALAAVLFAYHALFFIHIPVYDSTAMAYYCFTAGLWPLLAKLGGVPAKGPRRGVFAKNGPNLTRGATPVMSARLPFSDGRRISHGRCP